MAISAKAREKCLKRARKILQLEQKWGRRGAIFPLALAVTCWAGVGYLLYLIVTGLIPILAPNPAAQDAVKLAWATGVFLGFISGALIFKGIFYFFEGIQIYRGDVASHILVEYHDALESLMHSEGTES